MVKGGCDGLIGRKVNLATRKCNSIINYEIPKGNLSDIILFKPTIDLVIDNNRITLRDSSADGGYVSH